MLSWDTIRSFVNVAHAGSLSGAANETGLSIATLGRHIDALESELGLKLMRRGPSGAQLTPEGDAVLKLAAPGAHHFNQIARLSKSLRTGAVEMPVRISATEPMIAEVLAPRIPELLASAPGLRIEFEVSNALADLSAGDADIAVRLAQPKSDTLMARKLPEIELALYAAPSFLAGRKPATIVLAEAPLLWFDDSFGDIPENVWIASRGLSGAVCMRATSVRALLNAAVAGAGIAPLPVFLARRTDLIRLPSERLPARQPWLVFHRDTSRVSRMKHTRDWVAAACEEVFRKGANDAGRRGNA